MHGSRQVVIRAESPVYYPLALHISYPLAHEGGVGIRV